MRIRPLVASTMLSSALIASSLATAGGLPSYLVGRGLPEELLALERDGAVGDAERWIAARLPADAAPDDPLAIERERLARVRRDFSLAPQELLDALRKDIPDATFADIETWREGGQLQCATIDGEPRYFRKEPRNLFRVSPEARERRAAATASKPAGPAGDPNAPTTKGFDLHARVLDLLAEADRTGTQTPGATRIHAKHTITVDADAVPSGEAIRCWIPFPQEYERQRGVRLIASSHAATVAPNGAPQRTVFQTATASAEPTVFWIEYEYAISAYVPKLDPAKATRAGGDAMEAHLEDRPPHVDLSPELRALAAEIVGDETNPLLAAEKIFRWIDGNFRYCSEMEYSIVASITDKALVERAGDCGIHALLFVALCRANGIPARWQSGWAMRPGAENMHDWAEFRVEPWGWLPADPSFGLRDHDDPRVRDFYFGHIDPFRKIANLDYDRPFDPPKTYWRSDNIDNQRGEVEWSGGNLYYDQWQYKLTADYAPVAEGAAP